MGNLFCLNASSTLFFLREVTSISYVLGPHLYNQKKESRFSGLSDKYTGVPRDSLIGNGASVHVNYDTNEDIEL